MIPSRVCWGCCAIMGDKLVCTLNTARLNSTHDLRIPLCIWLCLQQRIGRTISIGSFFDLVSRWELGPYAPVTTERCSSDQIECRCSRVSVRRVNRAYNRPRFPLRTAKRLQALWARRWSWTRPRRRSTPSFARRRGRCHCGRGCDCSRRCGSRRGCCCCCCCWRRSSCAVAVAVGVGVGVPPPWQKISIEPIGTPVTVVSACQPNPRCSISVGGEIPPCIAKWVTRCPSVSAWIINIHFVGGIGRDSPAAHHIHLSVKGKRSGFPSSSRYGRNRANGIGNRVEAKRVGGVYYCETDSVPIRRSSYIDDAIDGTCGRIHDPFRRVHFLCPSGARSGIGIKLPDLVSRRYVDIKAAQDVQLVVSHCKPAWQNGACSIARPVVAAKEGRGISGRVVGKHASGGCGLARGGTTHAIDRRRP